MKPEQAESLRELIVCLGFTSQTEFADTIGWNKASLSRALHGKRRIPRKYTLLIATLVEPKVSSRAELEAWMGKIGLPLSEEDVAAIWSMDMIDVPEEANWIPGWYVPRDALLEQLKGRVLAKQGGKIVVVSGMPGVGKSTLLRTLLREDIIRKRFHQIFWFNGSDEPRLALHALASHLEVDSTPHSHDLEGLRIKLAVELRREKVLIAVDNATTSEGILALAQALGDRSKLVVTTQNMDLADKLRVHQEDRIDVGLMHPDEAQALVLRRLTDSPLADDPDQAMLLAELTGRLPLAVEIAACTVDAEGGWNRPLEALMSGRGLEVLEFDDPETSLHSMRLTLDLSYDSLSEKERSCLHSFGVFAPTTVVPAWMLASVLNWPTDETSRPLYVLTRRSLIQRVDESKYKAHPLIQEYAAGKADATGKLRDLEYHHTRLFLQLLEDAGERLHRAAAQEHQEILVWIGQYWWEILRARTRTERYRPKERAELTVGYSLGIARLSRYTGKPLQYQQFLEDGAAAAAHLDAETEGTELRAYLAEALARRGESDQGRELLQATISALPSMEGLPRATVLETLGKTYEALTDLETALSWYQQAAETWTELDMKERAIRVYTTMFVACSSEGYDYERADEYLDRAEQLRYGHLSR